MFGEDSDNDDIDPAVLVTQRPSSCGVLAFHNGTEEALLLYVKNQLDKESASTDSGGIINKADAVLKHVDKFCYERHWMMHIGDEKGRVLQEALKVLTNRKNPANEPRILLEIGSYCGYSSVLMKSVLAPSDVLISLDKYGECVGWTIRMIALAGVLNCIVLEGDVKTSLTHIIDLLHEKKPLQPALDLLFIDHDKSAYLSDLLLIESAGLLQAGSIVVADNVLSFGEPKQDYLDYVRRAGGSFSSSKCYVSTIEYADKSTAHEDVSIDGVEVSIYRGTSLL